MNNILALIKSGIVICILVSLGSAALIFLAVDSGKHSFLYGQELAGSVSFVSGLSVVLVALSLLGLSAGLRLYSRAKSLESDCRRLRAAVLPESKPSANVEAAALLAPLLPAFEEMSATLAESKRKEQAVRERAAEVICVVDLEGKLHSLNAASFHAWGYTPAELEGMPLADLVLSDSPDGILSSILGASRSISRIVFECKLKRRDGDLLDVVWSGYWSASEGGLFCIVHDITERKRVEEMLKQSERRLQTLLESLPAGVLLLSENGDTEFSNSAASSLLRCSEKRLELDQVNVLDLFDADVLAEMQETPDRERLANISTRALRSDGSTFPVEIRLSGIELSESRKLLLVFADKTAEHELEKLKNEFTSMVVHDLKAPLSSLLGMLELYDAGEMGQINDFGRELSTRVRGDIQRTLKLIGSLLELSKLKSGFVKLDCKEIMIKEAIEHAFDSVATLALKKNIAVEIGGVTSAPCYADEERIIQVLVNLLSNAIKFSAAGRPIKITIEEGLQSTKVTVTDTGRGLPADKAETIFKKFEQVSETDARILGGTGLGLSISKSIIDAHGGQMGAASVPGEGSSFWFSLPKSCCKMVQ